jgi:TolB-like protein
LAHTFGPFTLSEDRRLHRGPDLVPLGRPASALLASLAAAQGQPVTKEQLMSEVWPGRAVADVNLTVQIANLRKSLGRADDGLDWITSVPRFGYLLRMQDGAEAPRSKVPILAVVPFKNLTGDGAFQHIAIGLVDELVSALSRFRGFGVLSRVGLGHDELHSRAQVPTGANYVLDGSLQFASGDIRVVVTLASRDGRTLWSDRFDGRLLDQFDFQSRVVQQVAAIIEPRIRLVELEASRRKRPANLDAYDHFLRGRARLLEFEEEANSDAISMLEQAIAMEPDNGVYLGFACWAFEMRITLGWPILGAAERSRCIALAGEAIVRAADDAEVLARCGIALQLIAQEYARGLAVAERAAELNPNDPIALVNAGLAHYLGGSLDAGLEQLQYCISLQPNYAYEAMGIAANLLCCLERHDEALYWATRSLSINPNYQPSQWAAAASLAHLGRLTESSAAVGTLLRQAPGMTIEKLVRVHPRDRQREASLLAGLRLAGMPEN